MGDEGAQRHGQGFQRCSRALLTAALEMSSLDPYHPSLSSSRLWISFQDRHLGCQLFSRGGFCLTGTNGIKMAAQITISESEISKMTANCVKMFAVTWQVCSDFRCGQELYQVSGRAFL